MNDEPEPGVLGSLPRTRPHRRSDKRPSPAAAPRPEHTAAERPTPAPPGRSPGVLETAVQAGAELAEITLQASARALRSALSRLPRP